ncbi:hypothetical protein PFICI_08190 [Pestalotiopsis fici W106-1]|uniref:Urease accessory protein UreD n=1 Tax=Pestalotiopsis fici (strain W106-1 / CGMCC3.15140) TaxID=1229662 RepID=W3X662_PESFW|nr:uncharacterized protein PFICI_08190 [Pestalotiopsis fici W106-1]ETS80661.1 hypothetical protein PFICI_08190 [Pestalotiopsis fici W106-1]
MPHKHTRKDRDASTFDLPPTQIARPLPVKDSFFSKPDEDAKAKNNKRKREGGQNDMPRAFRRLMAYSDGKKPRSGLDNGDAPQTKTKKKNNKKAAEQAPAETQTKDNKPEVPTIRPGERMSEFAARVDAALPVGGLISKSAKNGKDPLGLKVRRTRKEKQMHKLYDEWREEERKIQEEKAEEAELKAEKEMEDEEAGISWKANTQVPATGKKKKKGKRAKYLDEVAGAEEDPWEELKRKRGESRPGLHDIAKAPPELHLKKPKKLTVRGATVAVDGVPKAAGSLRRREELQEVRDDIVASYRKLMEGKRPSLRQP